MLVASPDLAMPDLAVPDLLVPDLLADDAGRDSGTVDLAGKREPGRGSVSRGHSHDSQQIEITALPDHDVTPPQVQTDADPSYVMHQDRSDFKYLNPMRVTPSGAQHGHGALVRQQLPGLHLGVADSLDSAHLRRQVRGAVESW